MNYKLEYRTICFGIDQISLEKTQGIEGVFCIPAYQRGYRWTDDEVRKLLDDILESKGKPYNLQPIVVKQRRDNNAFELIDGQQRLTTLWLVLDVMKKGNIPFTLEYDTRKGSQTYLSSINADQAEDNIDYFHLHQAYAAISEWFENKYEPQAKPFLIDKVYGFLSTSVRVIWYEVPDTTEPIALFTRLNQGRIPLTDAELIKAVLLTKVIEEKSGREDEIAAQWDGIERDLHRDEIWAFIADSYAQCDERYPPRIGLLLDILAGKKTTNGDHLYFTFDKVRAEIEQGSIKFWNKVVALHAQIIGWFEAPHLYNKIGFLVSCDTPIGDIVRSALERKKSDFDALLIDQIKDKLKVSSNDLDEDLRYDTNYGYLKLLQLLLLFNVQSCRERFPFQKHTGQDWSLEHIHAQNAQSLTSAKQWKSWLEEHRKALQTIQNLDNSATIQPLIEDIDSALPDIDKNRFGEGKFNMLSSKIQAALNPRDSLPGADHSISNLTLLSHGANAALSNAVFEVKRQKVLEMDKKGDYIPVATRNVFLKYYTNPERLQPHFWGDADKVGYLEEIKKQLEPFLQ